MENIIEIYDLHAEELLPYTELTHAQLRNRLEPEQGLFIAESPKVIRTALDRGFVPVSFLMEKKHIIGDAADIIARFADVPVYTGERNLLEQLTGYTLTRGVLAALRRPALPEPALLLQGAFRVAVLDGIVDSTNIGAIFRSAAALSLDAVLLTDSCCDPLLRRAVRVSMGTVFQIPWAYLGKNGLKVLRENGFKLCAMALKEDSVGLEDPRLKAEEKLAIVLGTEGDGLSDEDIAVCDYTVRIPMGHGVDSLNVGAAAAVAFWELGKRNR